MINLALEKQILEELLLGQINEIISYSISKARNKGRKYYLIVLQSFSISYLIGDKLNA